MPSQANVPKKIKLMTVLTGPVKGNGTVENWIEFFLPSSKFRRDVLLGQSPFRESEFPCPRQVDDLPELPDE